MRERTGYPISRGARDRPSPVSQAAAPRGLLGLITIAYLGSGRAAVATSLIALVIGGLSVVALVSGAPAILHLFAVLVLLPAGLLVPPVVGVLHGQRLPTDYRQLGGWLQFRLWCTAGRDGRSWPLPAGALAHRTIRPHARTINARREQIAALSRGGRATVAALLGEALAEATAADAGARIDEVVGRVTRWEESATGLPPVGAKLYLRQRPAGAQAAHAIRVAAKLGVATDTLNYFWRGQVLLLPPARSYRTLAALVDALLRAKVAQPGTPLPLQITVQGALGEEAKLIALVQLLASGLDFTVEGPERRGDEGNLIARGRFLPERVAGEPGRDRTDFLFSLVWRTLPTIAAMGYADQHADDLRVVQTLSAALLAAERRGVRPQKGEQRLAAVWEEFAAALRALCRAWGAGEAVERRYLGVPFAVVRPAVEQLLDRKAAEPDLCAAARRLRDRALMLVEFTVAVERLIDGETVRRVRLARMDGGGEAEWRLHPGLRRVRRAIRHGGRVALVAREGDTVRVLLAQAVASNEGETFSDA